MVSTLSDTVRRGKELIGKVEPGTFSGCEVRNTDGSISCQVFLNLFSVMPE